MSLLKGLLLVLLKCVIVLAITWAIVLVLGLLPLPFMAVIIQIAWIIGGLACLWMLATFLIGILPG